MDDVICTNCGASASLPLGVTCYDHNPTTEIDMNEESNLVRHARRELALLGNDEEFNDSIIGAVRAFASYGHSGGSAAVAVPMLTALLQWKTLTPLTDDPDEWQHHDKDACGLEAGIWQSRRDPSAFSHDVGRTYHHVSALTDSSPRVSASHAG